MKQFILIMAAILSISLVRAQKNTLDSLSMLVETAQGYEKVRLVLELGDLYITMDTSKANQYLTHGLEAAKKFGYRDLVLRGRVYMASLEYKKGNIHQCLHEAIELIEVRHLLRDEDYSNLITLVGYALGKLGAYEMAIEYRKEFLRTTCEKNSIQYTVALDNIGQYYALLQENDSALVYFQKAARSALNQGVPGLYIMALTNVGFYNYELGNFSKCQYYFQRVENYFDTVSGKGAKDTLIYSLSLNTRASVHLKLRDFNLCDKLLQRSRIIQKVYKFETDFQNLFLDAEMNIERGNASAALNTLEIIYPNLTRESDKLMYYKLSSRANMSLGYSINAERALGEYIKLVEADKESTKTQHTIVSLVQSEVNTTIKNLRTERELAIRQRDYERIRRNQTIIWITGVVIVLILVIIFSIRLINRNKRISELNVKLFEEELKINQLKERKLKDELLYKDQDLTDLAMHINRKSDFLKGLKKITQDIRNGGDTGNVNLINQLLFKLKEEIRYDENLILIVDQAKGIHHRFTDYLSMTYPDLTPSEIEVCVLIRLNKSSKEIASYKGVEESSIKTYRYRIRQKMKLNEGQNLNKFLTNLKIT